MDMQQFSDMHQVLKNQYPHTSAQWLTFSSAEVANRHTDPVCQSRLQQDSSFLFRNRIRCQNFVKNRARCQEKFLISLLTCKISENLVLSPVRRKLLPFKVVNHQRPLVKLGRSWVLCSILQNSYLIWHQLLDQFKI